MKLFESKQKTRLTEANKSIRFTKQDMDKLLSLSNSDYYATGSNMQDVFDDSGKSPRLVGTWIKSSEKLTVKDKSFADFLSKEMSMKLTEAQMAQGDISLMNKIVDAVIENYNSKSPNLKKSVETLKAFWKKFGMEQFEMYIPPTKMDKLTTINNDKSKGFPIFH